MSRYTEVELATLVTSWKSNTMLKQRHKNKALMSGHSRQSNQNIKSSNQSTITLHQNISIKNKTKSTLQIKVGIKVALYFKTTNTTKCMLVTL